MVFMLGLMVSGPVRHKARILHNNKNLAGSKHLASQRPGHHSAVALFAVGLENPDGIVTLLI
jgi:hypothetical protein